jgi:hypothetical protein
MRGVAEVPWWRRIGALAVLVVGVLATVATSPGEPTEATASGPPIRLGGAVTAVAGTITVITPSIGADDSPTLAVNATVDGAIPVLISLHPTDPDGDGSSEHVDDGGAVVVSGPEGRGRAELDGWASVCRGTCTSTVDYRVSLLEPTAEAVTVEWDTTARFGDDDRGIKLRVGPPDAVAGSANVEMLRAERLNGERAMSAHVVAARGTEASLQDLALVVQARAGGSSRPSSEGSTMVQEPDVGGLKVAVSSSTSGFVAEQDAWLMPTQRLVPRTLCPNAEDCRHTWWLLVWSDDGASVDLDLDLAVVPGASAPRAEVVVQRVEPMRFAITDPGAEATRRSAPGPVTTPTEIPFDLPPGSMIVGWLSSQVAPSSWRGSSDALLVADLPGGLRAPVTSVRVGAPSGPALLTMCPPVSPCRRTAELTLTRQPPNATTTTVELFALPTAPDHAPGDG